MWATFSGWVKRHQITAYFFLAYAISWLLVSPLIASGLHLTTLRFPTSWHAFGALGPVLSAFCITALAAGRHGIRRWAASIGRWRVGIGWFLTAVFSPIVLFVLTAVALRLAGAPWPDFGLLASKFSDSTWLLGVFVASLVYGLGEEPGWRGFALPRLQQRWNALAASAILALFWALWHSAFFTYRYHLGVVDVFFFVLGVFAGSIWLTCLYNSTSGSVLMVILWHTTWNMVNAIAAVVSAQIVALLTVEVIVAAAIIVVVWKPTHLSPISKHTLQQEVPSGSYACATAHEMPQTPHRNGQRGNDAVAGGVDALANSRPRD